MSQFAGKRDVGGTREKKMTNNYVYEFGDSLYLNITNRCPNNCEFCIRNIKDGVSGSELWLLKEPTYQELVDDLSMYDLKKYKEVVFAVSESRFATFP